MTTIAYKDGILAADGFGTENGRVWSRKCIKIIRHKTILAGWSGDLACMERFFTWVRSGMRGKMPEVYGRDDKDFCAIIITPDGLIYEVERVGWNVLRDGIYAMGSGASIARGAMLAGASAEESVRIASEIDLYTGGDITTLRLHP